MSSYPGSLHRFAKGEMQLEQSRKIVGRTQYKGTLSPAAIEAHGTIEHQWEWCRRDLRSRFAGSLYDEMGQTIIRAHAAQRDVKQVCPDPSPPQAVFMTQTIAQFRHVCGVLRADA
jgi:hypothetical protein